jgi:archaellum biogenesis ATPase FlaH
VFRSILLEFDEKEVGKDAEGEPIMERIPLEVQLQSFIQSKAPIRAIEFSGNKSLHAYPKSGSRDETEHKQRAAAYMEFFGGRKMGIDESTKDPVRFSRLPDCYRSDVAGKSKLIALGMGAESYEAWMSEVAVLGSQLPELMKIDDLIAFVAEDDPDRLIGENRFLGKGTSFLISGHSGIGKSSLSLQKAICFSVEKPFLPRPDGTGGLEASRPVKTLIVQSENDLGDMAEAMQGIVTGLELTPDEIKLMKENIQIRHDTAHTGLEFIDMLYHLFAQFKADVILIDPLFAFVGADITKAEVIGDFFRKGLNTFMQVTKCIVIFMHHIPKPSTDPRHTRQGHDDIYSGAGSAELTNWARATATLKPMNGYFQLIFGKRSKRTGILNDEGKPTNCLELQHGKDGIFWERLDTGLKDEMDKKAEEARKKPVGRPKKTITFSEGATAAIQKFVTERDPSQEGLKEELKRLFSKESPGFVMEKILEAGIILKSEIPDAKNGERKFKFVVPE